MNLSFSTRFEVAAAPETRAPQTAASEAVAEDTDQLAAQLSAIDPATSAMLNEWLLHRPAPVFRMAEAEYELRWVRRAELHWHLAMELACGTHRAVIALDGLAAIDPLLVGEPFALMPEPLRNLAICRQLAQAAWSAPPAISQALEVQAVHWQPQRLPDWPCQLSFALTRRPEGRSVLGTILFASAASLQWLHASLPVDAASARARLTLDLPLRLLLGRTAIASDELAALGAGDVVWIESAGVTREGVAIELLAPLARRRWLCRARGSKLRVASVAQASESFAFDAPGGAHQSVDHGGRIMSAERTPLEAPVTFDLGEIHMKVQDLERLQPGQIVDLPQEVAATTVALRVAGRHIAEGMLVAVGRRLGVRISRICAGPHHG